MTDTLSDFQTSLSYQGLPVVIIDVVFQECQILTVPVPSQICIAGEGEEGPFTSWVELGDLKVNYVEEEYW